MLITDQITIKKKNRLLIHSHTHTHTHTGARREGKKGASTKEAMRNGSH